MFRAFQKLTIAAFVLMLGCASMKPSLNESHAEVEIPVHIHVINRYDASYTAVDQVNETNFGALEFVALGPITVSLDDELPTATWDKGWYSQTDGQLDIYIQLLVDAATKDEITVLVPGRVQRGDTMCETTIFLSSEDARPDTLLHELGHLFGLTHTNDPRNVMNPNRQWHATLTRSQLETMRDNALLYKQRCIIQ